MKVPITFAIYSLGEAKCGIGIVRMWNQSEKNGQMRRPSSFTI